MPGGRSHRARLIVCCDTYLLRAINQRIIAVPPAICSLTCTAACRTLCHWSYPVSHSYLSLCCCLIYIHSLLLSSSSTFQHGGLVETIQNLKNKKVISPRTQKLRLKYAHRESLPSLYRPLRARSKISLLKQLTELPKCVSTTSCSPSQL